MVVRTAPMKSVLALVIALLGAWPATAADADARSGRRRAGPGHDAGAPAAAAARHRRQRARPGRHARAPLGGARQRHRNGRPPDSRRRGPAPGEPLRPAAALARRAERERRHDQAADRERRRRERAGCRGRNAARDSDRPRQPGRGAGADRRRRRGGRQRQDLPAVGADGGGSRQPPAAGQAVPRQGRRRERAHAHRRDAALGAAQLGAGLRPRRWHHPRRIARARLALRRFPARCRRCSTRRATAGSSRHGCCSIAARPSISPTPTASRRC